MTWLFVLVVALAVTAAVVLAVMFGAEMRPAYDDRPDVVLPADRPLSVDDLAGVRFSTAVRGYRMSEVDALLARLRAEMAERDSGVRVRPVDDVTAALREEDRHVG